MKSTRSLCPECLAVIDASIFEEKGKMMIQKTCSKHGFFKDVYWSSAEQFERFDRYMHDGEGLINPVSQNGNCPSSCGICTSHKTTTILANIDVTNRCNQHCPVCFANSESSGYLYEPSLLQIRNMMQMLRNEKPVPCPAIQFSGGEPTMRDDLVEIVKMAFESGFNQIQMATNGVKLAKDPELCKKLNAAGLGTVYLQFDGVTERPYLINRGFNALPLKLKAIENCRAGGFRSISLVPTLAKGVNDDQVGDIIRFAVQNMDAVKGINFQPVSFAGRIDRNERISKRITIPDFLRLAEEQTDGLIKASDFYPVPFITPVSHFVSAHSGIPYVEFSVHPHCGTGTYLYIDDGKIIPITRFIDVEGLMEFINEQSLNHNSSIPRSIIKLKMVGSLVSALSKFIDPAKAPKSVDVKKLFLNVLMDGTIEATREFHHNTLFLGAMHFMDLYNFDLERVKRCGVHYATPDGRIIPFCTYNTIHRAEVEKKFSTPLIKVRTMPPGA
jgi:uncharacterized radical SAM superfamily Fe-S cluster-containing enzyme